jgi:hypothetical protein
MALKLAEIVVTEAGFASDLGAEKFFDIKCRIAGLNPNGVVIVATVQAVMHHGGFTDDGGLGNLAKHIENIRLFNLEPVVALNRFRRRQRRGSAADHRFLSRTRRRAVVATHYADGGQGAVELGEAVLRNISATGRASCGSLSAGHALKDKIVALAQNCTVRGTWTSTAEPSRICVCWKTPATAICRSASPRRPNRCRTTRADRPAAGFPAGSQRVADQRRRRLCGGDLRRDHDHARIAQGPRAPLASE